MKENETLNTICQFLTLEGYFFWRQNTYPVFDRQRGIYRKMPKYSRNGVPDIILIFRGIFVGIEVKTEKGVLSKSQKEFRDGLEAAGGVYCTARSVDDVIDLLDNLVIKLNK